MNASTWSGRLLCVAGVALFLCLCLAGPSRADEKDSNKGNGQKQVIVIQLDVSKAPPGLIKQLIELSRNSGKDDGKKTSGKKDDDDDDDDDDKKGGKGKGKKNDDDDDDDDDDKRSGKAKKGDDDDDDDDDDDGDKKKGAGKKSNVIKVDLNKLPPDLARRLIAELAKSKKGVKKGDDDDDDDEDDDNKKGGKKKKDD